MTAAQAKDIPVQSGREQVRASVKKHFDKYPELKKYFTDADDFANFEAAKVSVESGFNSRAVSSSGARGYFQITQDTWNKTLKDMRKKFPGEKFLWPFKTHAQNVDHSAWLATHILYQYSKEMDARPYVRNLDREGKLRAFLTGYLKGAWDPSIRDMVKR